MHISQEMESLKIELEKEMENLDRLEAEGGELRHEWSGVDRQIRQLDISRVHLQFMSLFLKR